MNKILKGGWPTFVNNLLIIMFRTLIDEDQSVRVVPEINTKPFVSPATQYLPPLSVYIPPSLTISRCPASSVPALGIK